MNLASPDSGDPSPLIENMSGMLIVFTGAMGSYVAFYLAGLYPLPGTRQLLLASPWFPRIAFYNPVFNSTTTIVANGFRGNPEGGKGGNVFVKVRPLSAQVSCKF